MVGDLLRDQPALVDPATLEICLDLCCRGEIAPVITRHCVLPNCAANHAVSSPPRFMDLLNLLTLSSKVGLTSCVADASRVLVSRTSNPLFLQRPEYL